MRQSPRSVLVVDDDPKIVQLVRTYLEREGFTVVEANDGRRAVDAFRQHRPDLVVLDLMLPELDGLEVCRTIREESEVPIVMLSARGSVAHRIQGINEGADDYLPKPFSPAELVARVRAVLRRNAPDLRGRGVSELRHHDLTIDLERFEVRQGRRVLPVTTTELRLLAALVQAGGRVLTRDQLVDALHGHDDEGVLDRTIDVHVGRLREKLADSAEQPRYVATVRGVGYRAAD